MNFFRNMTSPIPEDNMGKGKPHLLKALEKFSSSEEPPLELDLASTIWPIGSLKKNNVVFSLYLVLLGKNNDAEEIVFSKS